MEKETGKLDFEERYACSSAAGGLKIVSVGLVPELTAEAAKMASLGAGGKVLGSFAFELTDSDAKQIAELKPEIILLVGGTDGGNSECILHNSKVIADIEGDFAVIIAGNRNTTDECVNNISGKHKTYTCENVMPKFNQLNILPTQKLIRDIFLERIITAKGLTKATSLVSGIVNPTPAAVMRGIQLLAEGTKDEAGIGELIAVDVGGATTDVYTICHGTPTRGNTVFKGLPEPYAKRTVEGDIGMRYSIQGIVEAAGIDRVCEISGLSGDEVREMVDHLSKHTDEVPSDEKWEALDFALASMAIDTAVDRHSGKVEEVFTVMGSTFMQTGKDLSNVNKIVVTGGSLIHTKRTDEIAANALFTLNSPQSLRPIKADVLVDREYIIAAMGLLSEHYPEVALHIMKDKLEDMGEVESADAIAMQGGGIASNEAPSGGFKPITDANCHGF